MDRQGILWVLDQIDAQNVLPEGSNVQLSCPLAPWRKGHKSARDGKPSMGILVNEDEESLVNCFACRFGGTLQGLIEALHQYGDKDLTKLIDKVAEMEEVDPEWLANSIGEWDDPADTYEERVIDECEIAPMMGQMHPYIIRDRKIEVETLRAWGAGFDRKKMRAVFPVRRRDGALIGMVGRSIGRQKPKYLNYFDFDKGRYLYGEHLINEGTALVTCEGLLDSLATWQELSKAGLLSQYSVVSFLGSIATRHQLKKVVKYTDDGILFLDNDPAGWSGQLGAARYLANKIRVFAVKYPTNVGGDPAELMKRGTDIASLIQGADLMVV